MERTALTKATLGRLPQYLQYLKNLPKEQYKNISATAIAKGLSLGEVQVRKDLGALSGAGKPKVGYVTCDLINSIEAYLGCNKLTPAVLVGAGKLGKALLEYDGFEDYGVKIEAAFDCNEQVLKSTDSKNIMNMDSLNSFCRSHHVQIGIITVGQDSAQTVCDELIDCGITAIWNFAPCRLHVPDGVLLRQENLALSLAYLNNQLCK